MKTAPSEQDKDQQRNADEQAEKGAVGQWLRLLLAAYRVGVLAMLPALVAAEWMSAVSGWPSPLEPVAEKLVEWTPLPMATFLLLNLPYAVVPLALLGTVALLLLGGGVAGVIHSAVGHGPVGTVAAGGAVAFLTAFVFGPFAGGPDVLLVTVYGVVLLLFDFSAGRRPSGEMGWFGIAVRRRPTQPRFKATGARAEVLGGLITFTRRQAILDTALMVGGVALTGAAVAAVPRLQPEADHELFPYHPPLRPSGFDIPGLAEPVTPVAGFYTNSKDLLPPRPGPASLRIHGLVDRPLNLTFDRVQRLPREDRLITMECIDNPVGGPLIGTALWSGVRLGWLVHRTLPWTAATELVVESWDGYSQSVPIQVVIRSRALLAYGMNGGTLSADHGYPFRVIIPGLYGFKCVKWVRSISLAAKAEIGLWQRRGWTQAATIRTTTRIEAAIHAGGKLLVAGTAFAGGKGVARVQVRVNRGPWIEAALAPALSRDTWRQWKCLAPASGTVLVEARAVDGSDVAQTAAVHGSYPSGATGYASRMVSL